MHLFGEPPIESTMLAKKLTSGSDLLWMTLKNILYEMCRRDGVVCCEKRGLPKDPDVQEWLLDFVWLDKKTLSMKLAVEDERSGREAHRLDDFEKLMSVKAPLKLFVYATRRISNEKVPKRLVEYLEGFTQHVEGEQYLLMEVGARHANFYEYMVPSNGTICNIEFRKLMF